MSKNLREKAQSVKKAGRRGDKHLIHITAEELMALMSTGKVTRNPKTGLPEASFLSNITNVLDNVNEWHPLSGIKEPVFDLYLQGDTTAAGDVRPGSYLDSRNANLGLQEGSGVATFFAKNIAGALTGAHLMGGGGGESLGAGTGTGNSGTYGYDPGAEGLYQQPLMASAQSSSAGSSSLGPSTEASSSAGSSMPPAILDTGGQAMMPAAQPEADPTFGGQLGGGVGASSSTGSLQTPTDSTSNNPSLTASSTDVGSDPFGPSLFNPDFNTAQAPFASGDPIFTDNGIFGSSTGTGFGSGSSGFESADPSWWERLRSGMGANPMKTASNSLNLGSGLYGLYLANKSRQASGQYKGDPHRSEYEDQLAALMANPNSVSSMPGYQFGMDEGRKAIQRQGAASGSGGREAVALARYTPAYAQTAYQQQVSNLMNAARSGQPSGNALQGNLASAELVSRALASIGYGMQMMS